MKEKDQPVYWFAMRVTYARELKVKKFLDEKGYESFIPMCYKIVECNGQRKKELLPAVHNLIFIHITERQMKELKSFSSIASMIRYVMDRGSKKPLVVPDDQMNDFIVVSGSNHEQLVYLTPKELALKKGDFVRIKGGIWNGVAGKFVRIKRCLRVVVEIKGIMAVATASIHPSMVEKIS